MSYSGLLLNVYRTPSHAGCSNGGISEEYDTVLLIDTEKSIGPFKDNGKYPVVKLVRRNILGETYVHVEPVDRPDDGNVGWMAGGAYVSTSDGRFSEYVGHSYPVSLHDRQDAQEVYELMTQ